MYRDQFHDVVVDIVTSVKDINDIIADYVLILVWEEKYTEWKQRRDAIIKCDN
jgi:hypothetical protein